MTRAAETSFGAFSGTAVGDVESDLFGTATGKPWELMVDETLDGEEKDAMCPAEAKPVTIVPAESISSWEGQGQRFPVGGIVASKLRHGDPLVTAEIEAGSSPNICMDVASVGCTGTAAGDEDADRRGTLMGTPAEVQIVCPGLDGEGASGRSSSA